MSQSTQIRGRQALQRVSEGVPVIPTRWMTRGADAHLAQIIGFFCPPQDLLKHLGVDVVVLRPDFLDCWKLCCLLVVGEGIGVCERLPRRFIVLVGMPLHHHLLGLSTLLESTIVQVSATIYSPLQLFCLLLIGVQSVLVGFQIRHASDSRCTA